MKLLRQLLQLEKKSLISLTLLHILLGATMVVQAYFTVSVIYQVFLQQAPFEAIVPDFLYLLLAITVRSLSLYVSGRIGIRISTKAKKSVRHRLLNHYMKQPFIQSNSEQTGKKLAVYMDVVDRLDPYFVQYIPKLIQLITVPLVILAVVFTQSIYSGLILLITAPFIPFFMAIIGMKTKEQSEKQLNELEKFSGQFVESLQGLTDLKLLGKSNLEEDKIATHSNRFRDATMRVLAVAFTSAFMMEFISMLGMGLIALELSLRLIIFGDVSFMTAFFVLLLAPEFYVSLKEFSSAFHSGRESITGAKRLEHELQNDQKQIEWGTKPIENKPLQIKTENLSFHYEDERFQLNNLNMEVKAREHITIVGASGSGKTTLLHLLSGMISPTSGKVLINNIQLNDYKASEWFSNISYISQQAYIFTGTIKENISFDQAHSISETKLQDSIDQAGLKDFIESLPEGLNTVIGDGGRGISGGEKQRILIARAIFKQAKLIFFDEPTEGLDVKTEKTIQTSLKHFQANATIISVAHRRQTILEADRIIMLKEGKIVANGKHDSLLNASQEYKALFDQNEAGDQS
ncbi:thiol reductant ABC exporter subunit CydD [Halalkalibacillus halophilus]|uniref:thiol reductant ABC exporter subunit CydD n=1 Tax=Halalkalibacillus halophilus TaxID=392827 RepID=UPI0003F77B98|nr:thiol reductant ABC exporter subunit CydD [Halalkalibacillus halophilus]